MRSVQQDDQPNSWGTGTWAELSPAPRFAPGPSCGISHGSCTKSLQELQKHSGGRLAHCRAQGAPSQLRGTGPQLALTLHGSGRVSRGREAGSPSPGSVDTAGDGGRPVRATSHLDPITGRRAQTAAQVARAWRGRERGRAHAGGLLTPAAHAPCGWRVAEPTEGPAHGRASPGGRGQVLRSRAAFTERRCVAHP